MPSPIPIPAPLLRAMSISWTMESNHALASSPFSGHTQAQRGTLERWSFTMTIGRLNRRDAQTAIAFFLNLEGNLNTFLMHDPAQPRPLGTGLGTPVLTAAHSAGSRLITTAGWIPNTPHTLRAGDWVQIGPQLSRLRADAHSATDGTATLDIWPKLMLPLAAATPLITQKPQGIFRFTTDPPSWAIEAALPKPYKFSLTGLQEILTAP